MISIHLDPFGSADFSGLMSTSDLDKYADFIITAISTAVHKAIPTSKSVRPESTPISDETRVLIKEKRKHELRPEQPTDENIPLTPVGGGSTWEPEREQETSFRGGLIQEKQQELTEHYVNSLYKELSKHYS